MIPIFARALATVAVAPADDLLSRKSLLFVHPSEVLSDELSIFEASPTAAALAPGRMRPFTSRFR